MKSTMHLLGLFMVAAVPLHSQVLISRIHVPRQPYTKYVTLESPTDSATFYLTEFDKEKKLPLIIYIQGSGNQSLFKRAADGSILPRSGHIAFADLVAGKAKLLIVEKPGVNFLDTLIENASFDAAFSLESWSERIVHSISYLLKNENIDTAHIMLAGHSEGGVVAARVSSLMNNRITHTAILAGEGTSQLYSLYKFASEGVFFSDGIKTEQQRLDSLLSTYRKIQSDPNSTTKKFWGFTYKRWSSFLKTSVYDELTSFDGKVLIAQGSADKNVYPESAAILYTGLLSKNKQVSLKNILGADHSFFMANSPTINGWNEVVKYCLGWFLE